MKIFPAPVKPPASTPKTIRTAALIREELASAIGARDTLVTKLSEAEGQLDDAKLAGDIGKVQVLISQVDAIRMVCGAHETKIPALRVELAESDLVEAIAEGSERLPALAASARLQCDAFEKALEDAYAAEMSMFSALFDVKTGLRQKFATDELMREAARVRIEIRERVMKLAKKYGWQINTRFVTDGLQNLGPNMEPGFFHAIRRGVGNWL